MTVLRTDRLTLRPLEVADHAVLLAHWTDPRVRRYLFDDEALTPEQVTDAITTSRRDFAAVGCGLWALRLAASDLIGAAGLRSLREDSYDDIEIVYSLDPRYWGQGLASEAAIGILSYAFGSTGLDRVLAEIDGGNGGSAALAKRLGMRRAGTVTGVLGTMIHYVVTRDEWLESRRDTTR